MPPAAPVIALPPAVPETATPTAVPEATMLTAVPGAVMLPAVPKAVTPPAVPEAAIHTSSDNEAAEPAAAEGADKTTFFCLHRVRPCLFTLKYVCGPWGQQPILLWLSGHR